MGGTAGGIPGALCSVLVKEPIHPWDHVPQAEPDAHGGLSGAPASTGGRRLPVESRGTKVNPVEKKTKRPWEYPIEIRHGLGL